MKFYATEIATDHKIQYLGRYHSRTNFWLSCHIYKNKANFLKANETEIIIQTIVLIGKPTWKLTTIPEYHYNLETDFELSILMRIHSGIQMIKFSFSSIFNSVVNVSNETKVLHAHF